MVKKGLYFSYAGEESTHFELLLNSVLLFDVIWVCTLLVIYYMYDNSFVSYMIVMIVIVAISFAILIISYIPERNFYMYKYGGKNPCVNRIQIYIYQDRILYIRKLIKNKEIRREIKANNLRDIRVRPTVIIYRPIDYRKIAKEFDITMNLKQYEKGKYWLTLNLPKIDRNHKKELKKAVEEFKKRNKIGTYAK